MANNKPKMNWDEIDDSEYPLMLFTPYEPIHEFKVIEYMGITDQEIIDKITQKVKVVKNWNYKVIEDNQEKQLRTSSKRLMRALKPFQPLDGKTFWVRKSGAEFNTQYEAKPVKIQSKLKTE